MIRKTTKSLKEITNELKDIYENLYDINLYIYKSERKRTIIEIQYYPKSSLPSDFYKKIKENSPMLHCKIRLPYYSENDKKFDVNWELGGVRHQWNNFFWKLKYILKL